MKMHCTGWRLGIGCCFATQAACSGALRGGSLMCIHRLQRSRLCPRCKQGAVTPPPTPSLSILARQ